MAGRRSTSPEAAGSLLPEPIEQDLIVGALHDLQLLGDAPHQRLLVQRNMRDLVMDDAESLGDHVVALFGIDLAEDLAGEVFDLGIAIAAEIELPAVAILVAAADDVVEHVQRIERARRPAEQVE